MIQTDSTFEEKVANIETEATPGKSIWRWLTGGISVLGFILWFLIFPYQHWQFESRASVLLGWWAVLQLDGNAEWQFCLLVPLVALWFAWRQRSVLAKLPLQGTWWGAALMVLSGVLFWFGYKVDTGYLGFASLQLSLMGMILLLGGVAWMRALMVPWIFLLFAWPLFPLDYLLAAKLKIPTAWIAEKLLNLIGLTVVREGSSIQSVADFVNQVPQGQRFTLNVADSCSGMRSLYALIIVAVLYSFMALKQMSSRLILCVSAIPLAVAGNVVRLILLAVGSILFGQEFAVGKMINDQQVDSNYHLLAGFAVFGVALAGMFTLATWLEGRKVKKLHWGVMQVQAIQGQMVAQGRAVKQRLAAFVAIVAVILGVCIWTPAQPTLSVTGFHAELPEWVGGYHGESKQMSYQERVNFDPTVTLVRRHYTGAGMRPVIGTIVISGEMKRTLHTPEVCMPNLGWTVSSNTPMDLQLKNGMVVHASLMRMYRDIEVEQGRKIRLTAFNLNWYQGSDGLSTAGYKMSHYYSYRDSILKNLNHRWSQASFYMDVHTTEVDKEDPLNEIMAQQELKAFAETVASSFVKTVEELEK